MKEKKLVRENDLLEQAISEAYLKGINYLEAEKEIDYEEIIKSICDKYGNISNLKRFQKLLEKVLLLLARLSIVLKKDKEKVLLETAKGIIEEIIAMLNEKITEQQCSIEEESFYFEDFSEDEVSHIINRK